MDRENAARAIREGEAVLGLELGSTRIKAVLVAPDHSPIASGAWTGKTAWRAGCGPIPWRRPGRASRGPTGSWPARWRTGMGEPLRRLGALGFSAMMHGYLPFDREGRQLAEFRTWRNTITEEESRELTELFGFNIPQRWSIAHLWRAIRRGEEHVSRLGYLTTLAGYVHWRLTGAGCWGWGRPRACSPSTAPPAISTRGW